MFTKVGVGDLHVLVDRKGLHQSFTDHKVDLVLKDTIKYHKVEKSDPELAHFPQCYETPCFSRHNFREFRHTEKYIPSSFQGNKQRGQWPARCQQHPGPPLR